MLPPDHDARMERVLLSLDGLSVGDGFGERFFLPAELALSMIEQRALPRAPWNTTDDTEMAVVISGMLRRLGTIDRDRLARAFADRYRRDPRRGYGGTAHEILRAIGAGEPWREAAGRVFGGTGSMGNGGAMRAAPIGAYFAFEGDLGAVLEQARASAEVTHMHPEGQAGAIAIAVAAAHAARCARGEAERGAFFDAVLAHTPKGSTHEGIDRAANLGAVPVFSAAAALGAGERVISEDTVPFALWCASRHLDDYSAALWETVAGLGDRDTTCAIVGGIVALSAGRVSIPEDWIAAREPLRWD